MKKKTAANIYKKKSGWLSPWSHYKYIKLLLSGYKDQISLNFISSQISSDVNSNHSFICQIPIKDSKAWEIFFSKWHVQYTPIIKIMNLYWSKIRYCYHLKELNWKKNRREENQRKFELFFLFFLLFFFGNKIIFDSHIITNYSFSFLNKYNLKIFYWWYRNYEQ